MNVTGAAAQGIDEDKIDQPYDRSLFGLLLESSRIEAHVFFCQELKILRILSGHNRQIVKNFPQFKVFMCAVVLVDGLSYVRLMSQQSLDLTARSESQIIQDENIVRIVHRHNKDVPGPPYGHRLVPDNAFPRQEFQDIRFDLARRQIHE